MDSGFPWPARTSGGMLDAWRKDTLNADAEFAVRDQERDIASA